MHEQQPIFRYDPNAGGILDAEVVAVNGEPVRRSTPPRKSSTETTTQVEPLYGSSNEVGGFTEGRQRDMGGTALQGVIAPPTSPGTELGRPRGKRRRANHEKDQYPFGPPELLQYLPLSEKIRTAERYAQPGTRITWENHQSTDPRRTADRRAIISTGSNDGNVYYLHGNSLYDIRTSRQRGGTVGFTLTGGTRMPDITIGQNAQFTNGQSITEVIIATGLIDPDDSAAVHSLANAAKQGQDPFRALDQLLDSLSTAAVEPSRQDTPKEPYYKYDRSAHPERGGIVIPTADLHATNPHWRKPRATSRHGIRISPGVLARTAENPEGWEYNPRAAEAAVLRARRAIRDIFGLRGF